ncbi:MAG: tRNA (guanine(46)-N(7))-methyltransferase TrmB [Beijerinckiaceae bacterium]
MVDDNPERGRFFGRSKGKTLRQGQGAALERGLAAFGVPDGDGALDLHALFPQPRRAYRLEIGFGGGEHLVHRAAENLDVGFIGVEPFVNGMAKLLVEVEKRGIANIRVFNKDATMLLRRLPQGSLEEVCLLYPDPWPKRRQRKRRFVSEESLRLIARALKPGGLFRFASDIDDYVGWTLSRILTSADFDWPARIASEWRTPYPGWPGTRYEAKAIREGRAPSYLTFVKV